MAWIRYYSRLSDALVARLDWILPDGAIAVRPAKSGPIKSMQTCCMATRVRRCTAATGQ